MYDGNPLFGPTGISTLVFGSYGDYNSDYELSLRFEADQFYGRMKNFGLWDRPLNATEVAQLYESRDNDLAVTEGLKIFYKMDEGHGMTLKNLGSAGSKYDGMLGAYANGESSTTSALGSGSESCDAVLATSPTWVNKSGNSPPAAHNASLTVVESLSITFWFSGYDADGDMLNYTILSLPTHGALSLVNGEDTEATVVDSVPFDCASAYERYSLLYAPAKHEDTPVTIVFRSSDGTDDSSDGFVHISIQAVNDNAVARSQAITVAEDSNITIALSARDVDSNFVTFIIDELPSHGRIYKIHSDGSLGDEVVAFNSLETANELTEQCALG